MSKKNVKNVTTDTTKNTNTGKKTKGTTDNTNTTTNTGKKKTK